MKSRAHLKLVPQSEPEEPPCTICAVVVVFLFTGLLWWPIFYWAYH